MASSAFDLAEDVSSFVRDLKPWRALMPSALKERMEDVAMKTKELESRYPKNRPSAPVWEPVVLNLSMETWSREGPLFLKAIKVKRPCIVAYYRSPPSGGGSQAVPKLSLPPWKRVEGTGDEQNLQRVGILSPDLEDEIMLVTSISVQTPMFFPAPYKILTEYYLDFKARLAQLESELKKTSSIVSDKAESKEAEQDDKETAKDSKKYNFHLANRTAHLRCLVTLIEDNLGDRIQLRAQIADRSIKEIAFEDLWHLFKPGDIVYSREPATGRERLFKIYYVTGGMIRRRKVRRYEESDFDNFVTADRRFVGVGCWTPLLLAAYTMEFDGTRSGPQKREILIKYYSGKQPIAELTAYPVCFHPDKDLQSRFEKAGRQFLSSVGHRYYDGLTVPVDLRKPIGNGEQYHVRRCYDNIVSDVYVDFEEFYKVFDYLRPQIFKGLRNPILDPTESSEVSAAGGIVTYRGHEEVDAKLSETFSSHNRKSLEAFNPDEEPERLTSEFYKLLPQEVPAYAFRYRRWYLLDTSLLQPINPSRYSGFDDLVIPEHYKTLLTALVNNHTSGIQKRLEKIKKHKSSSFSSSHQPKMDIVPGKGEGLILLLHGPPGAGKTSTAETIAAYTRRPLYSITCGDIGLVPRQAEELLEEHTLRADKWGCVLLLDEADVFLMQRTWKEIQRNALVSVFLRQLEYYSGILFLTTNRPGTIDEAFKSRIHVSLRYPGIDLQSTRQMWENILHRLEKENETAEITVHFKKPILLKFAEQHYKKRVASQSCWNGRQIRNAFQTALALGHAARQNMLRGRGITTEDLEQMEREMDDGTDEGKERKREFRKHYMTVKLTRDSFKEISKTTNEFEEYIVALRGKDTDAQRDNEVRDDGYDPERAEGHASQGSSSPEITLNGGRYANVAASQGGTVPPGNRGLTGPRMNRYGVDSSEHDDDEEDEFDDDDDY
ncbi:hypothetical protein QBC37DRAFT_285202 [Rhypophila decipiens]|uniref:AAA+ ATPase domain-containing protein n=1 Tax=Rhypophila decipiens TaxID=261697 RepID=A0AAN7B842_9PEZI|nr:hypothetical protein QBC37DRAFT_285202 [Rhypophila decipiens]